MRLGFCLPQFGVLARKPESIARFARGAEDLGADSLWVGDRILVPVNPQVRYPGSAPDGPPYPEQFRSTVDPLVALGVAATATRRVWLGTSTLNVTWYSPVLLARALTSIDHVSAGRLVAGFGISWSPDEYQAVGVPWQDRGARLDEILDVLTAIWTDNPAQHDGPRWTVPASYFDLRPVQRPHPPIYLAASTPPALRRVGRRADGWIPYNLPVEVLADQLAVIRRAAEDAGRDPNRIGVWLRVNLRPGSELADVAGYLRAVEEKLGVTTAFVELMYLATEVDQALDLAGRILELAHGG